jgi:acetyl esterase/lipase
MRCIPACVLLAAALLARPAWAAKEARAPKTGGTFEIEIHKDIAYVEGKDVDERQKLDLYLPKGAKDYPTLFFIHGGGVAIFPCGDQTAMSQ